MPVLLSDEELEALSGLPHMHYALYISGIRRYMDYKTGIVGIKRKISYQSLKEEVYVPAVRGRHASKVKDITRTQVKRALEDLENSGLIKRNSKSGKDEKQLILTCVLAHKGLVRKNDDDPMMTPLDDPNDDPGNKLKNNYKNRIEKELNTDDGSDDDPSKSLMMTPPRGSELNIKKNNTTTRDVFLLLTQKIGFSERRAEQLLDEHSEKYISEKLDLVMGSENYNQGKIKNLPAYLQKAIADDFKGAQSIKNQPARVDRGDIKGSYCKAPGCKRKGINSFTIGSRWYWYCDEHLKIEQEREKYA